MRKILKNMAVSKVPELFEFNTFTNNLTNEQLDLVLRYFDFLRALIEDNQQKAALNMVRSLVYYLVECKATYPKQAHALTRAEQICGQFITLVELHCNEQHRVEWYADRLHLSPKYLSNVLKQTLNTSPNAFIDQAILRHAKSLLSSTSLSVQQISDRLSFQNQSHFGTFFKRHLGFSPAGRWNGTEQAPPLYLLLQNR